jgi:hypothetical protein
MTDNPQSSYIYYSERGNKGRKEKHSTYLVEQTSDEKVIKVTPLGSVNEVSAEHEIKIIALKNRLTVVGSLVSTGRGRFRRLTTEQKDENTSE